ncbi:MAG: F0F1 ATP synthase subunit B, partial [Verrucomicrobiota bacterium]
HRSAPDTFFNVMNSFVVFAAAAGGNPVAEIANQFGVTWQLLISQTILFVIVALALKKWAYQPILEMLEKRRQMIAESVANSDKIKQELANAQAKTQEIISQASTQANKIIEEARAAAGKVTEQETQKAIATAQDIIAKARQANEAEFKRLEGELKKEIGRLAVQAAMRVSGKILTAEDQQRLAEQTNRELAA